MFFFLLEKFECNNMSVRCEISPVSFSTDNVYFCGVSQLRIIPACCMGKLQLLDWLYPGTHVAL